ncbi:MAG: CDP-alcohol phosphatidyltransferase family protein [Deltaproteobacteria bacterium]|nr:CDP-alcohol phosphatidyltransferase family protein [Deltaproteobacteria bacterium]
MATAKGPLITANQVTLLRIVLLPVPCAMVLYASEPWMWAAVVLFVALGFTDLLDGWMARKWGTSVLGALLDPVADKVFMAAALIPMIILGLVHPAVVVVIMLREFLITSLRSAMSLRGRHVKTSVLAKLKTAVQMGGGFMVFAVVYLPADRDVRLVQGALAAVAVAIAVWRYLATRRVSPFVFVPCSLTVVAFLIRLACDPVTSARIYWGVIVVFTVASAIDYLGGAADLLVKGKGHHLNDLGRILWTAVCGAGIPLLAQYRPEIATLAVVLLSTELATGAVDNLRCHENFEPHTWIFPLRAVVLAAAGAGILQLDHGAAWSPAFWGALALSAVMFLWTLLDFIVARHLIWGEAAPETERAKGVIGR